MKFITAKILTVPAYLEMLKKCVNGTPFYLENESAEFFFRQFHLSGNGHNLRCCSAEEPCQSLDVLDRRSQEELFPHELQSPQTQTP